MRAAAISVIAALAAVPRTGSAQWRTHPMVLPAPDDAEVLLGRFSGPVGGDEILIVDRATGAAEVRAHGALLSAAVWPHLLPAQTALRASRTRDSGVDLLADIAYATDRIYVLYGATADQPVPRGSNGRLPSFLRGMPHDGDTLVYPSQAVDSGTGTINVVDFEAATYGGTAFAHSWRADGLAPLEATEHELFGVRVSPAALDLGVDDLALPTNGGVFLLVHRPATANLLYATPPVIPTGLALVEVRVGGVSVDERPPWLPTTIERKGDALGAAALDVSGDGRPDLVFTYGSTLDIPDGRGGFVPGRLVVVRGTDDPLDLGWPTGAWEDITTHPDLQPLVDPVILRQVSVGGAPAAAVWDRDLEEVVVFYRDAGLNALRAWRGDATGRRVRDIRVADVVGSSEPDLVVVAEDVLVYPDVADASPVLSWSPGSPGTPVRGSDHPMSVFTGDPNGASTLEWFVGDPYGTPVATTVVPAGSGQTADYVHPGALLCEPPPQTLAVTVRATDGLGVFDELSADLDVGFFPPALTISGSPAGRLVLPPGGTAATFDGSFPGGCGPAVTFTWGGTLFDGGVPLPPDDATPTTTRLTVDLPESTYPALLAEADPNVTLVAEDGGIASPVASLVLAIDASGLVEVKHAADVPALARGEVAVLRSVLRSRLGVSLPDVRVLDVLSGLDPVGAPVVTGAVVSGSSGAEVVLQELEGGVEVTIEIPVRSTGGPGASSVEVRSSGGHLLTPPAPRGSGGWPLPGCGCGTSGADASWALLALALAARRRAMGRTAT